jgi:hypothetical protein
MRTRRARRLAAVLAGLALTLAGTLAEAQTNDHFFRSWRWTREEGSARAAALGGAVVALGDDAVAGRANPAGLGSLSRSEVAIHVLQRGRATTPSGDTLSGGAALGLAAAAARLGTRWTAGLYAADTRHARLVLQPRPLPDGVTDEGTLEVRVREAGISAAYQVAARFHVGARLAIGHASVNGEYRRETPGEPTGLRVGTEGSEARLTGALGVVWEPVTRVRLGFAAEAGNAWTVDRTAMSPRLGANLDPGSAYRLRQPSALVLGASVRLSRKLVAFGQADRVRYGEIQSVLIIRQGAHSRDDYRLVDAWEPRAGLEVSLPLTKVSFQLRGGLERLAAGGLRYEGREDVERATFGGAPARLGWAVGGAMVAGGLRLDATVRRGGERPAFLAGVTARF